MENSNPLISVITPAYNAEKFIEATIQSVQAQKYPHWEMVIVDDCSKDRTVEIIERYQQADPRIKLIQLQQNSGPAVARNTAIRNAKGRYLAFLDSDDQWTPEKLARQLQFMQEQDIAFSFTQYEVVDEAGADTGKVIEAPEKVTYTDLLKNNVIGCLTVMVDTKKTGEVEMVNIRSRQDYALWLELSRKGFQPFGLNEPLAKYREVGNSLSSNKVKMARQNWHVYREIEHLSLPRSLWYFVHYVYFKLKKYST
ncbi:glycosyltransferase family 2 protein [Alkalihalobacterium elongatum]|uniref:glycosyltransferase family 2 protein n=1 Tax=Alkalihalobacterium elongatum TaxID=2675466 RepID=UPI0038B3C7E0